MMPKNISKLIWPAVIGGVAYAGAASRTNRGFAPLAFAGVAAYAVVKAMDNESDYISVNWGGKDYVPF